MRLEATIEHVAEDFGPCVVTIGVFDGVHRGHAALIARAVVDARARGLPSVLLTFEPHPASVLTAAPPPRLTTPAHRADLVAGLGIDALLTIDFTRDFAAVSAAAFVSDWLVGRLHVAAVVVGANFTYGAYGAGTTATLADEGLRHGFAVDAVELAGTGGTGGMGDTVVSATAIRQLIAAGEVERAGDLLGHLYRCDGIIVRGEQRGRALGYPTANVDFAPDSAVPADGVYAGRVVVLDADGSATGEVLGATAVSVGTNPTFDGRRRTVEAYILDFDADLYGQNLGVEFAHRLRGQVKFESIEALIEQVRADVEHTRRLMHLPSG